MASHGMCSTWDDTKVNFLRLEDSVAVGGGETTMSKCAAKAWPTSPDLVGVRACARVVRACVRACVCAGPKTRALASVSGFDLSVCLSVYLSVCLSICLSVWGWVSVCLSVCLSVCVWLHRPSIVQLSSCPACGHARPRAGTRGDTCERGD